MDRLVRGHGQRGAGGRVSTGARRERAEVEPDYTWWGAGERKTQRIWFHLKIASPKPRLTHGLFTFIRPFLIKKL